MKKTMKKLCIVLVSMMMVFSAVGIPNSFAEGNPVGIITLGSQTIWYNYDVKKEPDQIDGVSFDPSSNTLTFTNLKTDRYLFLYVAEKVTIKLVGTNYLGGFGLTDTRMYIDGDNNSSLIINESRNGGYPIEIANASHVDISKNVNFHAYGGDNEKLIIGTAAIAKNMKNALTFEAAPDKLDYEGTELKKQTTEKIDFAINKCITNGTIYSLKEGVTGDKYKKDIAVVPTYDDNNKLIRNDVYEKISDDAPFYQINYFQDIYLMSDETEKEKYNTLIANYNKDADITEDNKIYEAESVNDIEGIYKDQNNDQETYILSIDDKSQKHYYRIISLDGYTCFDKTKSHPVEGIESIMEPSGYYKYDYHADEVSVDAVITEQPKDEPKQPDQKPEDPKTDTESTKTDTSVAGILAATKSAEAPQSSQTSAQQPDANPQQNQSTSVQPKPTKTAKPGRVGNLKIKLTKKKAKVSWKKVKNAKKYEIAYKQKGTYYKKNKKGKKQKVSYQWIFKTVKKTSVIIKPLKKNKKYSFKVRAINGSKKGKWSKIKTVKAK